MKKWTKIREELMRLYPNAKIALNYQGHFQLLVAVILSAQCTDERVNMVTPALFKKYPSVEDFAGADIEELEKMVYSTGFYRNKAKNIKGAAVAIMARHGGEVPDTMEELLALPGVARKTANVVLHDAFGKAEGIVVDTHVMRLSKRLFLVPKELKESKNAVRIEKSLVKVIPREDWHSYSHLMIQHGRNVCFARKPACEKCTLNKLCPSAFQA